MSDNAIIAKNSNWISSQNTELVQKTIQYKRSSISPNTWRSYQSMWNKFSRWCHEQGIKSLPTSSEIIALYLSHIAESVSLSTLELSISAIKRAHKENNVEIEGCSSLYQDIKRGIKRTHKEKLKIRQANALSIIDLKVATRGFSKSLRDTRDRAIILLGFFGAFRRSEIVSLDFDSLIFSEEGIAVSLLGSKTSQNLEEIYISRTVDGDVCPYLAVQEWLKAAEIEKGPLFRSLVKGEKVRDQRLSGHSISHILKRIFGENHSGHSLRRGLVTETAKAGVPIHEIQKFSRHKSADMVLRYAEKARGFENTSSKALKV